MREVRWVSIGNGAFELLWEEKAILSDYAEANHTDGRSIDTRDSERNSRR